MIERDLTPAEIEEVLQKQCYAHVGFVGLDDRVNVLPITYVYKDKTLYSFSARGDKIDAMRSHPEVCVQVEMLHEPDSWKSVQMWGTYSEAPEKTWGTIETLITDFWKRHDAENIIYSPLRDFSANLQAHNLVYQIQIEEMVGKLGQYNSRFV